MPRRGLGEIWAVFLPNIRRVVPKALSMAAVWPDSFVTDIVVMQSPIEIRRTPGDDTQRLINTVARRGYLF